jgi:hypothetical protein
MSRNFVEHYGDLFSAPAFVIIWLPLIGLFTIAISILPSLKKFRLALLVAGFTILIGNSLFLYWLGNQSL